MKLRDVLILLAATAFCLNGCAETFPRCEADGFKFFSEPDTRSINRGGYFEPEYNSTLKRFQTTKPMASTTGNATMPGVLVGLGLSGGGVRSNAFQLGILNGLNNARGHEFSSQENGTATALDNIAFLSSVSGGTWAAAGYMAYRPPDGSQLDSGNAFFKEINDTVIKDRSKARCAKDITTMKETCQDNATRILNNSYASVLRELPLSYYTTIYSGYTMREAWRDLLLGTHLLGRDRQISEMDCWEENRPVWIANMTHSAAIVSNTELNFPFQVTPFGIASIADCGNTKRCAFPYAYHGFYKEFDGSYPAYPISQVMAMSGAVLPQRILGKQLNLLEWDVPAPQIKNSSAFQKECNKETADKGKNPFANALLQKVTTAYAVNADNSSLIRQSYVLTDGGQSENLGGLALMERGVDLLILSDGAYDPDFTFGDYKVLKSQARALLGYDIALLETNSTHQWKSGGGEAVAGGGDPILRAITEDITLHREDSGKNPERTVNKYLFYGAYSPSKDSRHEERKTRDVIYIRPPYNIDGFIKYLEDAHWVSKHAPGELFQKQREMIKTQAQRETSALSRPYCLGTVLDAVQGKTVVLGMGQPPAADDATTKQSAVNDTTVMQPATASASAPSIDEWSIRSNALMKFVGDTCQMDGGRCTKEIHTLLANATVNGASLGKMFDDCEAFRKGKKELVATREQAALAQVDMEANRIRKYGSGEDGYIATRNYLLMNTTDFPRDKTFALSFDRQLMYAYYLLGTYIGEKLLAPQIGEFLAKKAVKPVAASGH